MRNRLGRVLWWLGAIVGGLLGLTFLVVLVFGRPGAAAESASILLLAPVCTVPAWAACYVVAGSFWKPPSDPGR